LSSGHIFFGGSSSYVQNPNWKVIPTYCVPDAVGACLIHPADGAIVLLIIPPWSKNQHKEEARVGKVGWGQSCQTSLLPELFSQSQGNKGGKREGGRQARQALP
jgi:hypothetical protein